MIGKVGKVGLDRKGRMSLKITLPLPPSDNAIYTTIILRRGKSIIPLRKLTTEARAYKTEVKQLIATLFLTSTVEFRENVQYTCLVRIYFRKIYNLGWPQRAKTRYKKEDAQDRIKLVTDAVSEVIGIDDSHHFLTVIQKREGKNDPRIELVVREQEPRSVKSEES
jgi:Holliday junction resolvase RusA-like endonuclease